MCPTRRSSRGFTLLEMLLVVAIIAILAGIVIVAINPVKQIANAQDAQRESDINTIYKALNQYYIDKGSYPSGVPSGTSGTVDPEEICDSGSSSSGASCSGFVDLESLVPTYIQAIPRDPTVTTTGHTYYDVAINANNGVYVEAAKSSSYYHNTAGTIATVGTYPSGYAPGAPSGGSGSGSSNYAIQFNGSSGTASVADFSGLPFTGDFSIDFWVKGLDTLTGYPGSWFMENNFGDSGGGWVIGTDIDGNLNNLSIVLQEGSGCGGSGTNLELDSDAISPLSGWHHVVISRSGSNLSMYIDGTLQSNSPKSCSGTFNDNNNGNGLSIGGYPPGTAGTSITLDHLKLISAGTTLGDWEFNEGSRSTAANSSGVAPSMSLSSTGVSWATGE